MLKHEYDEDPFTCRRVYGPIREFKLSLISLLAYWHGSYSHIGTTTKNGTNISLVEYIFISLAYFISIDVDKCIAHLPLMLFQWMLKSIYVINTDLTSQ